MKYGERLKQARTHARLSQAALAAKIESKFGMGCTQENISKLERGDASGSEFTALFAWACDVNPIWLTTGTGEMIDGEDDPEISAMARIMAELPKSGEERRIVLQIAENQKQVRDLKAAPSSPKKKAG